MQLTRSRRELRCRLLASSCALLATASAKADTGDLNYDFDLLYYAESGRVKATEPTIGLTRNFGSESSLSARIVVDSLTGATPTGEMPSSRGNSVTGASGSVSSAAGELPLAPFSDLRGAVSATWSKRMGSQWHLNAGGDFSVEQDFRSWGANASLARDFNQHNTTLSLGASYEGDDVIPHGGVQLPLGEVGSLDTRIASDASKTVEGALASITQVMTQSWIAQLNYSYSWSRGYLNDPYKVVSVLNTHLGGMIPIFGPPIGEPVRSVYENRPDTRNERVAYLVNKVYLSGDVAEFSYRYGTDDWGIRSNTFELRYRWAFGDGYYLQPHLRYYHQTAADFYERALLDFEATPTHVSSDYRLADITGRTIGLELGTVVHGNHMLRMRLERYLQSGKVDPGVLIGVQQDYDSFPDLEAYIAQISYSF